MMDALQAAIRHAQLHKAASVAGCPGELIAAHDNLTALLPHHNSPLPPLPRGIYLPTAQARLLIDGRKKLVLAKSPIDLAGRRILCSGRSAWGIAEFDPPQAIDAEDIDQMVDEHHITPAQRKRWWGDASPLYAYRLASFIPYPTAITASYPSPPQTSLGYNPVENQVVVKDFVWLVGSFATRLDEGEGAYHDADILIRADYDPDRNAFLIDGEGLMLLLRNALDPDRSLNLHFLGQPQGPHQGTAFAFADLVLRFHPPERIVIKAAEVAFPKPAVAFFTEHFTSDQLWEEWGETRAPFYAEAKYNGFRALLSKEGDRVSLIFEGGKEQIDKFPDLRDQALQAPVDFVLDGDVDVVENGQVWPRVRLAVLNSPQPDLGQGQIRFVAFDVLRWEEDTRSLPFRQRRALLEEQVAQYLPISEGQMVGSLDELRQAWKRLSQVPGSEGLMAKTLDAPYPSDPSTDEWSKIKKTFELKVQVIERHQVENGFNYTCGVLADDSSFPSQDGLVTLGKTMNTTIEAEVGDILTVQALEVIVSEDNLAWQNAMVQDIDVEREEPYTADQVVRLAERAGVLAVAEKMMGNLRPLCSPGGKGAWVDLLIEKIPPHSRYVEPYAGGAALFWTKEPSAEEVLCDLNEDLMAVYLFLRDGTDEDFAWMRAQNWKASKSQFDRLLNSRPRATHTRAYRYKYLNLHSHRGNCEDYSEPHNRVNTGRAFLNHLEDFRERLQGVKLEVGDALKMMKKYDGPDTFFYLDPPWKKISSDWPEFDEEAFVEAVKELEGKVLISYQGDLDLPGFKRYTYTRTPAGFAPPSAQTLYWNYELKEKGQGEFEGLQVTLIGSGAMNSPRLDACLLVQHGPTAILFDGGPDITPSILAPYTDHLDAIFVSDIGDASAKDIRRLAEEMGCSLVAPEEATYPVGDLLVDAHPTRHTNRPTFGFIIRLDGTSIAWAPEFFELPDWLDGVDVAFIEAAAWGRPIRFVGGVGGHADVLDSLGILDNRSIGQIVLAHIGKPTERALADGWQPDNAQIGYDGLSISFPLESRQKGGPREEAAGEWWDEHWWEALPPDGQGEFTYQHHYPALEADQLELDEEGLLQAETISVHGDLRLTSSYRESKPEWGLWGFTVFEDAEAVKKGGGCGLCSLGGAARMRGTFKLPEPVEWLDVARRRPYVSQDVGTTGKAGSKFFEVDHGTYRLGVCKQHSFEIFFYGERLKGRYLITYVPVEEGEERIWMIGKPDDQTPYAESHNLDDDLNDQRKKHRQVLVWAAPDQMPVFYDVQSGKPLTETDQTGKSTPSDWRARVGLWSSAIRDKIGHVRRAIQDKWPRRPPAPPAPEMRSCLKTFIGRDGRTWLLVWSSNAFEDREGEIFSTRALEDYVARHENDTEKGKFRFHHIPGTDFATIVWQGVTGRFLVEAGVFDDTLPGRVFGEFFRTFPDGHPDLAPEGWGASVGCLVLPGDGSDGVYDYLEKIETSILPRSQAANPYTAAFILEGERKMLTHKQKEALRTIGGDELVEYVESGGRQVTHQLEDTGVRFKTRLAARQEALAACAERLSAEDAGVRFKTRLAARQEALAACAERLSAEDAGVRFKTRLAARQKALADYAERLRAVAETVEEGELKEAILALADKLAATAPAEVAQVAEEMLALANKARTAGAGRAALRLALVHRHLKETGPSFRNRPQARRLMASPQYGRRAILRARIIRQMAEDHLITPEEAVDELESILAQCPPNVAETIQQVIKDIRKEFGLPAEEYPAPQMPGYAPPQAGYTPPEVGYAPPEVSYPRPMALDQRTSSDTRLRRMERQLSRLERMVRQGITKSNTPPKYGFYRASELASETGSAPPRVVHDIVRRMQNL